MEHEENHALLVAGLLLAPLGEAYDSLGLVMDSLTLMANKVVVGQASLDESRLDPLAIQDLICAVDDLPAPDTHPILIVVHYRVEDLVFQTSVVVPKVAVSDILNHVTQLEEEVKLARRFATPAQAEEPPRPATFADVDPAVIQPLPDDR